MKLSILALLLLTNISTYSQKITDDFSGVWKTTENEMVTITKSNQGFLGLDALKRKVLYDIKFIDNEWRGKVTNYKKNITGRCELRLEGNRMKIVVRKGILFRTFYWLKK